ncbi:hypothetical protein ACFO4N_14835 [Camelliibacillus cellulosilyticus]|uniref:ABC-2 family transporter n=1 Tax=Camelliibacillus cellulosilyticus TaxID=2174486 RepID=A0ABV9GPQ7_9BACL
MLKMELTRISRRLIFWLLILVGFILAILPVIQTWPHHVTSDYYVTYPGSPYVMWMYFVSDTFYIYELIFPLLAALAFSDAYAEDVNTGLIKSILTKIEKKRYLLTRYTVNFCVGGIAAVFPLAINLLAEMTAYPMIDNNFYFGMALVTRDSFAPDLFYHHPIIYVMSRLVLLFLLGGILASVGLALSTVVRNRYIVVVIPFLVYVGLDVLFSSMSMDSIIMLFMRNIQASWQLFYYLLVGFVSTFIWYFLAGDKNETL